MVCKLEDLVIGKYKFQLQVRMLRRKRNGDQTDGIWEGQQHIVLPHNYLSCAEGRIGVAISDISLQRENYHSINCVLVS